LGLYNEESWFGSVSMMPLSTQGEPSPPAPFVPLRGNNLALDLVNTEHLHRRKSRDLLQDVAQLQAWWNVVCVERPEGELARELAGSVQWNEPLWEQVREFRWALRDLFTAVATGTPLPSPALIQLNNVLANGYPVLQWRPEQGVISTYQTRDEAQGGILLPIALAAARLLQEGEHTRVRACPNCIGLFYDTSKSGTRKWCSERCMGRARSREYYQATKRAHLAEARGT